MASEAAHRAVRLVGTRFRPQGREPATGLDCLGLVLAAHRIKASLAPRDYRLRGDHGDALLGAAERWFRRVRPAMARPGDVLVLAPAPDQLHLAILTPRGFVHADAGLGKVVETPGDPAWPMRAILRRRARQKRNTG